MAENNVNNGANGVRNNAQLVPAPAQPVQPRQPQNLQGLLRFAMEAREPDAPPVQELPPMEQERREFLARALQDMVTDAVVVLRTAIPVLTDAGKIGALAGQEELSVEVKSAFQSILDVIEDLDVANDFCKLGGFDIFMLCYNTSNPELWVNANDLLAGVCQNFPSAQSLALERGLLEKQLELLQHPDTKHKDKFVYAISCSVREFEPGCRALAARGGAAALAARLQDSADLAGCPRLHAKAARLLLHLLEHYPSDTLESIQGMNLPGLLVPLLAGPPSVATEHLLLLLRAYVKSSPQALQQARAPDLGLKEALEKIISTESDSRTATFEEILIYSTDIVKTVFEKVTYDCAEEADR